MRTNKKTKIKRLLWSLVLPLAVVACAKDMQPIPDNRAFIVDNDISPMAAASRTVNFSRPDGVYTKAQAEADFGGAILNTWKQTDIYSNQARVRVPANSLSNGNIVNIDVADGTEYELSFRVRFGPNFDWSRGGKVGFGFHIGNGYTGCNKADNGLGGTARLMWYNGAGSKTNYVTGGTYFRPYVYYRDMPDNCGNSFGKQSKQLNKNVWYTVKIRVKSNTGSAANGYVSYEIDGVTLLSQSIRWTTNDDYRKIRYITFHTFRGGSQEYWQSTTDGLIYYDDLVFTRISS